MVCWRLRIEYDGTRYSGWQEQRNAPSVMGALRTSAEAHFGERVDLGGAGRTDAGVHAIGQVAHLRVKAKTSARSVLYGINDGLPADVNVLSVEPASKDFDARRDAILRSYVYQISRRRTAFAKRYVWWIKDELDEGAMATAAGLFVGRHDFRSFTQRGENEGSTTVVVEESRVERHGDLLLFRIAASHFLWKMVRRLVGTLVAAGRGSVATADVESLLLDGSGETGALTAPPSGLFLEQVLYSRAERRRALGPVFNV